jgi:NADPH:quinone reductase-like Zn-dependent oxidoreductase
VLKAAHFFDSVPGTLTDGAVIVVQGNRIQAVGAAAPLPADAQVVDLGDATLLPGFIDAHVHLSQESRLLGCTIPEREVFLNLIGYIERSEIRPVIGAVYPLREIVAAQTEFMRKSHVGKIVLTV